MLENCWDVFIAWRDCDVLRGCDECRPLRVYILSHLITIVGGLLGRFSCPRAIVGWREGVIELDPYGWCDLGERVWVGDGV